MEPRDIIAELLSKGLTQMQIAQRSGLAQPTISKVLLGVSSDVMSKSYRKLLALHEEVVGARCVSTAANDATHAEQRNAA